ncbi:Na+/H+ antiporter subunit E [Corynebacterium heidelbergense]|uniref:MnhE protein n=1 Tax=Corynebacterium heidelbergense TaxID=2055947 RepID=A0A364V584_9CORY|nr:Na+/H+ antiporter subunit E [Corynebacterium heidelbergense]RAV31789.1 MnhE protein [Corynebacterium heidelbergense]
MSSIGTIAKATGHSLWYAVWLTGQVIKESITMTVDTLGSGRKIAPVVIYYPLRVNKERDIAALIASITMTPGTLALGVTGPKEVDYDAVAGERSLHDAHGVASKEYDAYGRETAQRFLAVHAMYGQDPCELLHSLADMEEHLAPSVRGVERNFRAEDLVERGRPGPRGFRGTRGGRASDETVFDVEKLDSTPHTEEYVAQEMHDSSRHQPANQQEPPGAATDTDKQDPDTVEIADPDVSEERANDMPPEIAPAPEAKPMAEPGELDYPTADEGPDDTEARRAEEEDAAREDRDPGPDNPDDDRDDEDREERHR